MQASSNEWPLNHQEMLDSIDRYLIFDYPFDVPELVPIPTVDTLSPKASSNGPKTSTRKPIKRRSRDSNKSPTTLLKADPNNFRALVQQFTGSHCAGPVPFGSCKGPINLNFEQFTYYPKAMEAAKAKQKQKQKRLADHDKQIISRINSATVDVGDDDEVFAGVDALTCDGLDVEELWGQEMDHGYID